MRLGRTDAGRLRTDRHVNRDKQRGRELTDLLNDRAGAAATFVAWEGEYQAPEAEVLINATSIGLFDGEARIPIREDRYGPA